MDGKSFDALVKSIATSKSRRSMLKGVLATAAGVTAISAPAAVDAAQACRGQNQICRKHGDCCSNLCGPKDRFGRQTCCQTFTIEIDSTNASPINTGFFLSPGDVVSVSATGSTSWCDACEYFGPDGQTPCGTDGVPFNCGSYVGAISTGTPNIYNDHTEFFTLGTGPTTVTATTTGALYVQYVDGCDVCAGDNDGVLQVTISSCGAPQIR